MNYCFLQSPEWEEFQKSVGRKTWRIDGVLMIKMPLTMGNSYLYAGGMNFQFSIFNFQKFVEKIAEIAKKERAIFFKVEPMSDEASVNDNLIKAGFKKSSKEVQPQKTIIFDIEKSEEELLAVMHEKTRYNIRLAERKDLRFTIYDFPPGADPPLAERAEKKAAEVFWQILQKTSNRDNFHTHPKDYYKKLLEMANAKLFAVEYKGKVIAANIILFHKNRAVYLHGASDYEYRNLMAPYLLHWHIIKYAREQGFSEYDLWGIDEKKWPGVTRFKKGFGGKEISYVGSYDYVFSAGWYGMYSLRNKIRSTKFEIQNKLKIPNSNS
jgi:lipid II:glycine glycyltransferase (peptidoglycan interpeptide bridge formation enzyme)